MAIEWDGAECTLILETDVPGGQIDPRGFRAHIDAPLTQKVDCINTAEDPGTGDTVITLCFVSVPSAADKTALATAIGSYTYEAPDNCRFMARAGTVDPVGNVIGNPGDTYTWVDDADSLLYQHRGASANDTDWVEIGDAIGPSGAFHDAIVRFNGDSGKILRTTPVLVSDVGEIYLPLADTSSPIGIKTTGTNGAIARFYVGDRDPTNNVTGLPGDTYTRVGGTNSRIYQHQGASSSTTGWVELGAGGGGSTYTHGVKTRTEMIDILTPSEGDTVFCSTYSRPFWWTGNTWQTGQTVEVTNKDGGSVDEGNICKANTSNDLAIQKSTVTRNVLGVVVIGGADGDKITMATSGVWPVTLTGSISRGNLIIPTSTAGVGADVVTAAEGCFGIALEAQSSGTHNINCQISQMAELLT